MNIKIVLGGALLALGLSACGQQEQPTEENAAPVVTQEAPALETAPADAAMDATAETPAEGEAPALEGTEETGEVSEAAEEPPVE